MEYNYHPDFDAPARFFKQHGVYCRAPEYSEAYKEYWDEQTDYCINGITRDGIHVTGRHYFYLNFNQINAIDNDKKGKERNKTKMFPRFLDMDWEYYTQIEEAIKQQKGIVILKARRKGFSFKNASIMAHKYNFFRDSLSIVGAYLNEYAHDTFNKAIGYLNFLNENTAWRKRQIISNANHVKSGYIQKEKGITVIKGYQSEIKALTFKDKYDTGLGKSVSIFLFEEAGKWPGLISAYTTMQPAWQDGAIMVGLPIIFGTGGDIRSGSPEFAELFYNPTAYNMLAFQDVWKKDTVSVNIRWENSKEKKCGYFVPAYKYYMPYVTEDGKSLAEEALKTILKDRKEMQQEAKVGAYIMHVANMCVTPREAFMLGEGTFFPREELENHLTYLLENDEKRSIAQRGWLYKEGNDIFFDVSKRAVEADYPYNNENKEGCVVIYEHPEDGAEWGQYIAGCDPYSLDEAYYTDSLGATYIYKRFTGNPLKTHDVIVAEYVGRPRTTEDYFSQVLLLLEYYNAVCLHENQSKDMKTFFVNHMAEHRLADQPDILLNTIQDTMRVSRSKGIHMSTPIKDSGLQLLKSWLLQGRGEGKLNLDYIPSINLVRELIAFNRHSGNYDRIMAMIMVMFLKEEMMLVKRQETPDEDPLGVMRLYQKMNKLKRIW